MSSVKIFFNCVQNAIKHNLLTSQCFGFSSKRGLSSSRALLSLSRKDVNIPVPISGEYIAAQLWEKAASNKGAGSPSATPMICIHGFQDTSNAFDPLIPLIIKDGMTVVSVDLPGHGLSSPLAGIGLDSDTDGVAAIHRVMHYFNWEKVILMGHSYGSFLSFMFTSTFPDKVEKYIAIDNFHPIPRNPSWHLERICKQLFKLEDKFANPNKVQPSYTFEEMVKRVDKGRQGTVTENAIRILLKRGAKPDPEKPNMFKFTHDLKMNIPNWFPKVSHEQCLEMASRIKCPVCVLKGDPGVDFEPREVLLKVVDVTRKANGGKLEFHLIPGTHHFHLNDPQSVAPIISNFLES